MIHAETAEAVPSVCLFNISVSNHKRIDKPVWVLCHET